MIFINNYNTDPYFNLAAEEFLLKNKTEDIFMLWIAKPSVIVGKHQNTLAEINYRFIKENNITIARRLSGGGTVFHDKGNLNFTWILNGESGKLVDFKKFINPVIDFLNTLNINAVYGGRNDILVQGKKISGNAEHVYKHRTLHHGTLLFNTNLEKLRASLIIEKGKYSDKAVKSVPSSVANINEFINSDIEMNTFRDNLCSYIKNYTKNNKNYKLTNTDIDFINELYQKKFKTWDWNFRYSPKYIFQNDIKIQDTFFNIMFHVEKGKISNVKIKYLKNIELKDIIIDSLENNDHREESLYQTLKMNLTKVNINDFDIILFVKKLF